MGLDAADELAGLLYGVLNPLLVLAVPFIPVFLLVPFKNWELVLCIRLRNAISHLSGKKLI